MTPSFGNLRRTAAVAWWSMVLLPFAFMVLVFGFAAEYPVQPQLRELLFWIAIAGSAFQIALSRVLPGRLAPRAPGPDAVAFARLLVAWALCESAALFPLVAYLVTGDPRLVGVFGVDLLALVLLYPSDGRWESAAPAVDRGPPAAAVSAAKRRMVR